MAVFSSDDLLAEVGIAPGRLFVLVGALFGLGVIFLGLAVQSESGLVRRALLALLGIAAIWQADRARRASSRMLRLKEDGLYSEDGTLIAAADQITRIDRGALAFKPSNGFALILRDSHPHAWVPGVWWRRGRRVGVGGIVSAGATKFMAERIAALIKDRDESAL